jgi:anti-sigma factor RsiW
MAQAGDLTCRELVEIVTDYLEGALPASERERFESHLRQCAKCTTYLQQMESTIAVMGTLTENGIEPAARDHLLHLFRDWHRTKPTV